MKIAVTTQGNEIFQHFGSCKEFTVFEAEGERIIGKSTLDTSESGHGALAELMKQNRIDVLICGGIGSGAKSALRIRNIEIVPGVTGSIETAVKKYLSGEVIGNPDFVCGHHHGEEDGVHGCGHHGDHEEGPNHQCHCSSH